MTLTIQRLFIYPIKSLAPVEVKAVELTEHGLRFDRSFALIYYPKTRASTDGPTPVARHLTIKRIFRLALFEPEIDESWSRLTIRYTDSTPPSVLTVPLTPSPLIDSQAETFLVSIFGTTAKGIDVGPEAAAFFSQHLKADVRLVFIGGLGYREIPGAYFPTVHRALSLASKEGMRPQRIKFADAAPLLITSTASEQDARKRLQEKDRDEDVILRFRSNIHVDAEELPPYDEDEWQALSIRSKSIDSRDVTLKCIFPCVRCLSINADLATGDMVKRERQMYGLLASDRRINNKFPHKPVFGQYAFGGPTGAILRLGDEVIVTERSPHISK